MGIDHFKDLYVDDEDFTNIYKVCFEYKNQFHSMYVEYTFQNDLLFFKGISCVSLEALLEKIWYKKRIMDLWMVI